MKNKFTKIKRKYNEWLKIRIRRFIYIYITKSNKIKRLLGISRNE